MHPKSSLPKIVTTITPQRVSFCGGGTDFPGFYLKNGGAVVSSTIDKYIYVTVKRHSPLFNEAYRISYSTTEHVDHIDLIQNDVARECLKLVQVPPPLFISTASDLPASSGLGSSSSFAVGLLYALHALRGENVSAGQLAEEASQVEIEKLKRPIGKQDQYAAAFGGLNYIHFQNSGRVLLDPLWMPDCGAQILFDNSMLFWTGLQRQASDILDEQQSRIDDSSELLTQMFGLAKECRELLLNEKNFTDQFGALLHRGWNSKKKLASKISTPLIDILYEKAVQAGSVGGKIAGAGGGGFLFLIVPIELQEKVKSALSELAHVPINYEPRGSRILSMVYE